MYLLKCLVLYFIIVSTNLPLELMNKCKLFNIKETDCMNSSFIPSSKYNGYLKSFNMPVIRDDYCKLNKCTAFVSNEIPPSSAKDVEVKQQSTVANMLTLTSTTTSTVVISVNKQESSPIESNHELSPSIYEKEFKLCEKTTMESKNEMECEPIKSKQLEDKPLRKRKRKQEKEEDYENKHEDRSKELSITTLIREIPTTVIVEVPLTLFREHTTTSISKIPIVNYSLTTFTEKITSIETIISTKTTTLTEEIFKTSTITTEIQKTATITMAGEVKFPDFEEKTSERPKRKFSSVVKEEEDKELGLRKYPRKKENEFQFPGYFKDMDKQYVYSKQKESEIGQVEESLHKKEAESNLTSTVYITVSSPIVPQTLSPAVPSQPMAVILPSTSQISKVNQFSSLLTQNLKPKEDSDENIIPLLKEFLRNNLASKRKVYGKPKKFARKIYRTVYEKKKRRKCIPKDVCVEKKCSPTQYDRICEDDNDI